MDHPGEISTPTSDLTKVKLYVNSIISDIISRYVYMGIKYFYLNNRMDKLEYIIIQAFIIPE